MKLKPLIAIAALVACSGAWAEQYVCLRENSKSENPLPRVLKIDNDTVTWQYFEPEVWKRSEPDTDGKEPVCKLYKQSAYSVGTFYSWCWKASEYKLMVSKAYFFRDKPNADMVVHKCAPF